jgi:hypothetical protein
MIAASDAALVVQVGRARRGPAEYDRNHATTAPWLLEAM